MTHLGIPGLALLCGVAAFGLGQKLLGIPWQHSLSFATPALLLLSATLLWLFRNTSQRLVRFIRPLVVRWNK